MTLETIAHTELVLASESLGNLPSKLPNDSVGASFDSAAWKEIFTGDIEEEEETK